VCETCNGGWLSELEGVVKPIIIRMLNGIPTALADREQLALAAWIT